MKNEQNITVEQIAKHYEPAIHSTCDQITNLSASTIGYYAYLLQEEILKDTNYPMLTEMFPNKNCHVTALLTKVVGNMKHIKISLEETQYNEGDTLYNFSLFFQVEHEYMGNPIVLRNGYLLKCLYDAGIRSFEELENYEAALIYNKAQVNAEFCSFVEFKKK